MCTIKPRFSKLALTKPSNRKVVSFLLNNLLPSESLSLRHVFHNNPLPSLRPHVILHRTLSRLCQSQLANNAGADSPRAEKLYHHKFNHAARICRCTGYSVWPYALGASEQEAGRRDGICAAGSGTGFESEGGEVGGEGGDMHGPLCACVAILSTRAEIGGNGMVKRSL